MIERRAVTGGLTGRLLRAATAGGAPVTYALIGLCCAIFLISPLSGFNPTYGTADNLLAAQAGYFERWG